MKTSLSSQGQYCDICSQGDSDRAHPITNAIDGTERWWQSPPLSRSTEFNEVNVTLDLGQVRHSPSCCQSEIYPSVFKCIQKILEQVTQKFTVSAHLFEVYLKRCSGPFHSVKVCVGSGDLDQGGRDVRMLDAPEKLCGRRQRKGRDALKLDCGVSDCFLWCVAVLVRCP